MRKPVTISIDEEDERVLRQLCDITGMSMSKLFQDTVKGYVAAARATGILKVKKASKIDMLRFFARGARMEPIK